MFRISKSEFYNLENDNPMQFAYISNIRKRPGGVVLELTIVSGILDSLDMEVEIEVED